MTLTESGKAAIRASDMLSVGVQRMATGFVSRASRISWSLSQTASVLFIYTSKSSTARASARSGSRLVINIFGFDTGCVPFLFCA